VREYFRFFRSGRIVENVKSVAELAEDVRSGPVAAGDPVTLRVGSDEYELAGSIRDAGLALVQLSSESAVIDIASLPDELTTGQAADLLGVSRPTVVDLVDRGAIPARRVGTRRRLLTRDVLAYRARRSTGRRRHLKQIGEASEALGLYD
jgi:excisionase family DNA binding protein